jgi:long-subunit acyl-CoA synthetase (AMP-forming)
VVGGLDDDEALAQVERRVQEVNQRFARAEQVRRVGLLPRTLSIETGERSASGTVIRNVVVEGFRIEIADLYR